MAQENAAQTQATEASLTAEPLDAQLARLVGAKKTMLVVKTKDGATWSFQADHIKALAGSTLTLKKRTPFISSQSEAPEEKVVQAIVSNWWDYPSSNWGGVWVGGVKFVGLPPAEVERALERAKGEERPAGMHGYTRDETLLEIKAILKVQTKAK